MAGSAQRYVGHAATGQAERGKSTVAGLAVDTGAVSMQEAQASPKSPRGFDRKALTKYHDEDLQTVLSRQARSLLLFEQY